MIKIPFRRRGDPNDGSHNPGLRKKLRPMKIGDDSCRYSSNVYGFPISSMELGSYLLKLRNDVNLQIGLYRGILGYQEQYACLPFKDRSRRDDFIKNWLQVYESPQAIMNVIDDLKVAHYRRAFVVGEDLESLEPLEKEAFALASRIWHCKVMAHSGVKATNTEGNAPSTLLAFSDQNNRLFHDEIWRNVRGKSEDKWLSSKIDVMQTVVNFLDKTGMNLLEQDPLFMKDLLCGLSCKIPAAEFRKKAKEVKEYYEETKKAGLLDARNATPDEKILMNLADRVWQNNNVEVVSEANDDYMDIELTSAQNYPDDPCTYATPIRSKRSPAKSYNAIKLLRAIHKFRKRTGIGPIEDKNTMKTLLSRHNIRMSLSTAWSLVKKARKVYDQWAASGLLTEFKIVKAADRIWGDDTSSDLSSLDGDSAEEDSGTSPSDGEL